MPIKKFVYRKSKKNKVACVLYSYGQKYEFLRNNAASSFSNFHPDVDLYVLDDVSIQDYMHDEIDDCPHEIRPYIACLFLMQQMGYEKTIKIGGDTITCGRLDLFMDDLEKPKVERAKILATLDYYNYQCYPYVKKEEGADLFSCDNLIAVPTKIIGYEDKLEKTNMGKILLPHIRNESNARGQIDIYYAMQKRLISPSDVTSLCDENFLDDIYQERYKNNDLVVESLNLNADIICFNSEIDLFKIIIIFDIYRELYNSDDAIANYYKKFKALASDVSDDRKLDIVQLIEENHGGSRTIPARHAKEIYEYLDPVKKYHYLGEQGALNIYNFLYGEGRVMIVDHTRQSNTCYNVRSFGTMNQQQKTKYLKDFYVKNGKFYNHANREIKIFHYCDGIGGKIDLDSSEKVKKFLDEKFHSLFPEDVISFFKKDCKCENIL